MRRIDVIGWGFALLAAGGFLYVVLQVAGLDSLKAGLWSQVTLMVGLILWVFTYSWRVVRKDMTYHQQREQYDQAWLAHRIEQLSPEELERLQREVEGASGD
jgi:membrane protein implicated in regulation of membrane protease activity